MNDYYRALLAKNGFDSLKFVKATDKNHVYLARQDGGAFFVKITSDPRYFDNIRTEVIANNFISQKAQGIPLRIPKSTLIQGEDYVIGCFEHIPLSPLASQEKHKLFYAPDKKDLLTIYRILRFLASIKKEELPSYLLEKTKTIHNAAAINEKVHDALKSLDGVLSSDQKKKILANIPQMHYRAHFSHHDFAPWNMFREDNGNFVLIDSEFARWGIKWYDEAYFFLKTYISLESPDAAKKSLEYFIEHFKKTPDGKDIESEILLPLHYIIFPSLLEAKTRKRKVLAEDMLNRILTMDMKDVLK